MVRRSRSPKRRGRVGGARLLANTPALGTRMFSRGIVLRGRLGAQRWKRFLAVCAEEMGMTPVGDPAVWKYPLHGGAGGNGYTFVQPITDSFLMLDTWPDHDGAYLFICSCRPFSMRTLCAFFATFDLEEDDMSDLVELRLA
jgi:hypothetical protein